MLLLVASSINVCPNMFQGITPEELQRESSPQHLHLSLLPLPMSLLLHSALYSSVVRLFLLVLLGSTCIHQVEDYSEVTLVEHMDNFYRVSNNFNGGKVTIFS